MNNVAEEQSYLDLGYDIYLIRNVIRPVQQSANETDSMLELAEGSVGAAAIQQGAITSDKIEYLSIKGWTTDITFSATDYRTVAWSAGTITLLDGTTFSISAGNTGAMSGVVYIYFDKDASLTVLQITSTNSLAVGANKIAIAVAQNVAEVTKKATFQVFGGKGGVGTLIVTDNLAANAVTTNELAANSVDSNKVTTGELITLTGQIKNGIITNAKIDSLDATKITSQNLLVVGAAQITGTLTVGQTAAKCTDPNADQTSAHTAAAIASQGALATLSVIGNAYISGDLYARSFWGKNSGSGQDIILHSDGLLYGRYNTDVTCYLLANNDQCWDMHADNNIYLRADSVDLYFDHDNDGSDCHWRSYGDNLRFKFTNNGNATCDGSWTGGGADYAELFESISGQEIPIGTTVVLVGDKIRPAKKGEEPIGAISSTASFLATAGESDAGENWSGKYLKDDLGRHIEEEADFWRKETKVKIESVDDNCYKTEKQSGWSDDKTPPKGAVIERKMRRKENPDWDKTQTYIPRVERPEWNIVGLVGQVRVLKGQPISKNWIKMKEISENVDLFLIK